MNTERLGGIELQHRYETVNGVRLHWVEAGAGPLVVLLHGFPDFWFTWRRQIPALAAAGLRVAAVDLRGYNESDRPVGRAQYTADVVATDIAELITLLTAEGDGAPATLVGHDWGGVIAWRVAQRTPEALRAVAILNAPHPAAYRRELRHGSQLWRSWYIGVFQLPWLPEAALRAFDLSLLRLGWRASSRRAGLNEAELSRYRAAYSSPGAVSAPLAYYRGVFAQLKAGIGSDRIELPTLVIWGVRDPALSIGLTKGLERWVADVRVEVLPEAGHWVHLDEPETVNRLLLEFATPQ